MFDWLKRLTRKREVCPMCDVGHLIEKKHDYYKEIDNGMWYARVGGLRHSICDQCGSYIVSPEQSRFNKQKIMKAK